MKRISSLGDKQNISLITSDQQGIWRFKAEIMLNAYNAALCTPYEFVDEETAFGEGCAWIHDNIQNHLKDFKQTMSWYDQELIIKFFES